MHKIDSLVSTHDGIDTDAGSSNSPIDKGTANGAKCQFPFHEGNYISFGCDTSGDMPWCGTVEDLLVENKWGYCIFDNCKMTNMATGYGGKLFYDNDFYDCDYWDYWSITSHAMPESTLTRAENYCRNPTLASQPWCYDWYGDRYSCGDNIEFCKGFKYACKDPLIGSKANNHFLASSEKSENNILYSADKAKIASPFAWCSENSTVGDWVRVDLGEDKAIIGIGVKGMLGSNKYVTKFKLQFSFDDINWHDSQMPEYAGPTADNKFKVYNLTEFGRFVKVLPLEWNIEACVKLEVGGCKCE